MKDNFFKSMMSEGGKISSKRWIAVTTSAVVCFGAVWGIIYYPQYYTSTMYALMLFIAVISGVATLAQVISLVRGTPLPPVEKDEVLKEGEEDGPGGDRPHKPPINP